MVNAAKRTRILAEKLYQLRSGPGSVPLPPSPAPQIRQIYLRLPSGHYRSLAYYLGARNFWHTILQRLKYWNPTLPVKVDLVKQGQNEPLYMTVTYEAAERAVIDTKIELPRALLRVPKSPNKRKPKQTVPGTADEVDLEPTLEEKLDLPGKYGAAITNYRAVPRMTMPDHVAAVAPKDEIKQVAQPAVDPSSPQTTSPPSTVFQRTITLPLAGMREHEIFWWMKQALPQLKFAKRSIPAEERTEAIARKEFNKQSQEDRLRVKRGVEALKREQAELKKAREAASAMQQEA